MSGLRYNYKCQRTLYLPPAPKTNVRKMRVFKSRIRDQKVKARKLAEERSGEGGRPDLRCKNI